jgi:hypothetical protein
MVKQDIAAFGHVICRVCLKPYASKNIDKSMVHLRKEHPEWFSDITYTPGEEVEGDEKNDEEDAESSGENQGDGEVTTTGHDEDHEDEDDEEL